MMQPQTDGPGEDSVWRLKWADLRQMGILPSLVLLTTLVTCAGFGSIGPFAVKGYAWTVLFVAAGLHLVGQGFRSTFPQAIWLPWILYISTSLLLAGDEHALQRTALLVCPCIVGASLASLPVREETINAFFHGCRLLLGILFITSLARMGVLATWSLPAVSGLAGESMTAVLLASLFAAEFAAGVHSALYYWAVAFFLPIAAVVRGGIMAALVTLPFTFSPMRRGVRLGVIVVAGILAVAVFQSERVQRKMFQSGSGTMAELRLDNPDLSTSGRVRTWELLIDEARKKPWFGHGANANEAFIAENVGIKGHPHNDWLRLFFDYGYIGSVLFGLTVVVQVLHTLAAARRAMGMRRLFLYAGASGFVPFAMLMMTDNVVLYAGFFGNLQFALLGLGYSSQASDVSTPDAHAA